MSGSLRPEVREGAVDVSFASGPLGVLLKDVHVSVEVGEAVGTPRVVVSDVAPGGQAASSGLVALDQLVVAVNGIDVEHETSRIVGHHVAQAQHAGLGLTITFLDGLAAINELRAARELAPRKQQFGEESAGNSLRCVAWLCH